MMVEETDLELAASAWMRWVLEIPTVIAFRLVLQYLVLLRTRTRMGVQIQREEEKLYGSLH